MYVRHGGFVDGAELFDCGFFGMSPAEVGELLTHGPRKVFPLGSLQCQLKITLNSCS